MAVVVGPFSPVEGSPFSGMVAAFSAEDLAGPPEAFRATIAWGDGTTTPGSVRPASGSTGGFEVVGSKVYPENGPYIVSVQLSGAGASSASGSGVVRVAASAFDLTPTTITPTAGQAFSGVVATFSDANPSKAASGFVATIAWGDGTTDSGTIRRDDRGQFLVSSTHVYAAAGQQTIGVRVSKLGGDEKSVETRAIIVQPSLTAAGTKIVATAGLPITGPVASFQDANPGSAASDYVASIDWGDGRTTAGTVVPNGRGGFDVVGTNVYQAPAASRAVVTTIARRSDGASVLANSAAVVGDASPVLSGRLDPTSDTGASNTDGLTAISQPIYLGTAQPYSIVQIFARRSDQARPVLLGQAIANQGGQWNMAIGPLPDGSYTVSLIEVTTNDQPGPPVPVTAPETLIINTRPPAIEQAVFTPKTGRLTILFRDSPVGLETTTLVDPSRYRLVGPNGGQAKPVAVSGADRRSVALRFDRLSRRLRDSGGLKVRLSGLTDRSGNPVEGRPSVEFPVTSRPTARHAGPGAARTGSRSQP